MSEKRWTGKISDGKVRVRLAFITERALAEAEAGALTKIVKARVAEARPRRSRCTVQPNYIKRPHWVEHPERDALGDIPTIGWVKGSARLSAVPDDLTHRRAGRRRRGSTVDIADHPDAEAAVRGIGSDGRCAPHLMAAVMHLLRCQPAPRRRRVSPTTRSRSSPSCRTWSSCTARRSRRTWRGMIGTGPTCCSYLDGHERLGALVLDHPGALNRKTIKLVKEERAEADTAATREAIFAASSASSSGFSGIRTGSRCTATRRSRRGHAAGSADRQPQVDADARRRRAPRDGASRRERGDPDAAAQARRRADRDAAARSIPTAISVRRCGAGGTLGTPTSATAAKEKMCRRSEEAEEVEKALLDVESSLCKQGRGKKAIKCPLYDVAAIRGRSRSRPTSGSPRTK